MFPPLAQVLEPLWQPWLACSERVSLPSCHILSIKYQTVDLPFAFLRVHMVQGCTIYLLDRSAAITMDDCKDCRVLMGPVESSVFIRDCKDCNIVVSCRQFR